MTDCLQLLIRPDPELFAQADTILPTHLRGHDTARHLAKVSILESKPLDLSGQHATIGPFALSALQQWCTAFKIRCDMSASDYERLLSDAVRHPELLPAVASFHGSKEVLDLVFHTCSIDKPASYTHVLAFPAYRLLRHYEDQQHGIPIGFPEQVDQLQLRIKSIKRHQTIWGEDSTVYVQVPGQTEDSPRQRFKHSIDVSRQYNTDPASAFNIKYGLFALHHSMPAEWKQAHPIETVGLTAFTPSMNQFEMNYHESFTTFIWNAPLRSPISVCAGSVAAPGKPQMRPLHPNLQALLDDTFADLNLNSLGFLDNCMLLACIGDHD